MHRSLTSLAAAAAALGSVHGAAVDMFTGEVQPATDKFIAGVPVLNYERAYQGKAYAAIAASAHTEDWIVMLKPEATDEHIGELCGRAGLGCFQKGQKSGIPFVAMHGTEDELALAVQEHSHLARYIQPDQLMWVDPVEDTPQAPSHAPSGQNELIWGLQRIGADKRSYAGRGVHVYVADTGIRIAHEEFGGRAFPFVDVFIDTNDTGLCTGSDDPECSTDHRGHGTHCAGTVAGVHYGVAPQAMVHAVKVLSDFGSGTMSGILQGMNLVGSIGERPTIISMSLGGDGVNPSYKTAIDDLTSRLGVTVVVAAGNEYKDACTKSPAYVPSAITVGATASDDTRSGFSNFGTCVDIWAPGTDIESADGRTVSHGSNNGTRTISGTSMACPHISGGVALLLEAHPTMTPAQLLEKLRNDASVNYITDLSAVDRNNLLYVGNDGPQEPQDPPAINWPPDEFFGSCELRGQSGPRGDYPVCQCSDRNSNRVNGSRCFKGTTLGCPIGPDMAELDENTETELTWFYSIWNCTDCHCYARGEEPVEEIIRDISVAAGRQFSFFVDAASGRAMAMGRNRYGQLGIGDMEDRATPTEVALPAGRVREVSAGRHHSLFLMESGEVYAAGRNQYGQLGREGGSAATPVQLALGNSTTAMAVATGHGHSLVLLASGNVLGAGCNHQGQLGDGTMEHKSVLTAVLEIQGATAIAAGYDFSYFIAATPSLGRVGDAYATGNNLGGQLGDYSRVTKHTAVRVLGDVKAIAAGYAHGLFLMSSPSQLGMVRRTGANFAGQLGIGNNEMQTAPVLGVAAGYMGAERVMAGADSSAYVGEAGGKLYAFGSSRYGQLGLGDVENANIPTEVAGLSGHVLNGAFGDSHSMSVTWAGKVYSAGANSFGELGDGTNVTRRTPVEIFEMYIPGATTTQAATTTMGGATTTISRGPQGGVPQMVYWAIGVCAVAGVGALLFFQMQKRNQAEGTDGATELAVQQSTEP